MELWSSRIFRCAVWAKQSFAKQEIKREVNMDVRETKKEGEKRRMRIYAQSIEIAGRRENLVNLAEGRSYDESSSIFYFCTLSLVFYGLWPGGIWPHQIPL